MIICYFVENRMYLNITNKCTNDCVFCIRNFGYSLRLEREPSMQEIWEDINRQTAPYEEIVFCGFGEPVMRLDEVVLPLSKKIKQNLSKRIRLNTNGHAGFLYRGRNVAEELANHGVDTVSVSLVAETAWLYNFLCKPKYIKNLADENAHKYVLDFIAQCGSREGLEVEATAVYIPVQKMPEGVMPPNIGKCKNIAETLGVKFRPRMYSGPNLTASVLDKYSGPTKQGQMS